jgi:apolipoprotein N-acyltransferase
MLEVLLAAVCSILIVITCAAVADVLRSEVPSTRIVLAWVIAIVLAPVVGPFAWFLRGRQAVAATEPTPADVRLLHDEIDDYLQQL